MAQNDGGSAGKRRPVAFISHHSSQEQTARHLKTILERNGVTGWMAPDDIDPGVAFDQAIIEQVERSDLIVLLFCSKSDQSRHVKRELMMAENNKKLIYPVRLEDIDAKGLAYWLNDYQWIDWIDRRDATIQRMIETIKRQVGHDEPADDDETDVAESAPAPAEPVPDTPAETAPVGLMGDGSGDGDSPPRFLGIPLNRKGWYAIGGGAVLAAILLGLFVNSMAGESEFKVRPGQWETRYEVDRILENRSGSQADVDAFVSGFEANVATHCISEAEARSPGNDFFDPDRANNCAMSNLQMEGGDFRVQLECRPPNIGVALTVWMRGDYRQDRIDAEAEYAFAPDTPNEFRFVANQTGRYLGPCE
ncbi:TIR domain-containing protein [Parasphingopyxis algicola]|uniref:TIR domain-containing protein n=1 Tax=Parasphingopyxis algicola TaxID=2026624 RepID=UPI0015A43E3A|nr:TIR domain-containing protein [Parasphingopyxis algicola]QLC25836.1 TIR domain-containing protein [Parasphingopyxis algicola]